MLATEYGYPVCQSYIEFGKFGGLEGKKKPSRIAAWPEPKWAVQGCETEGLLPKAPVSLAAIGFRPPMY